MAQQCEVRVILEPEVEMETKVCGKCKEEKTLEDFYKSKDTSDGYKSLCKTCYSIPRQKAALSKKELRKEQKSILLEQTIKICGKCQVEKPKSDFGKDSARWDGLRYHCKDCGKIIDKDYREKNPDKTIDYCRDYYKRNKEEIKKRALERWENNRDLVLPTEQICSTCGELKPISEFTFLKRKYVYELQCRKCEYKKAKEREKELFTKGLCIACRQPKEDSSKKYCAACNKRYAEKSKNDRLSAKKQCIERLGGACARCGLITPVQDVYDFHHTGEDKEINVGLLLARHRSLSKKVIEEVDKCILYCANCHRIIHWELNNNSIEEELL